MTDNKKGKYEISIALDRRNYSTVKNRLPTIFIDNNYIPLFVAICLYLNDDTIEGNDESKEEKLNSNSNDIEKLISSNETYVTEELGKILGVSPEKLKLSVDEDDRENMLQKYNQKNNIQLQTSPNSETKPRWNLGIRRGSSYLGNRFSFGKVGVRRKSRRVRRRTTRRKLAKRRTYRR